MSVPDFWLTITLSVAATLEFATVNVAAVAEPAAEKSVIAPQTVFPLVHTTDGIHLTLEGQQELLALLAKDLEDH